jgi:hypothetical protein
LPAETASKIPKYEIVPHPEPVAAGKVTAALLDSEPLVGLPKVTACRAYAEPDTSVPPPEGEGVTV